MRNDLRALPWAPDQLHVVDNYWEAAGLMCALKQGVDPVAVRRPLLDTVQAKQINPAPSGESGDR
jgi:hypothetical protein